MMVKSYLNVQDTMLLEGTQYLLTFLYLLGHKKCNVLFRKKLGGSGASTFHF